MEPVSAVVGLLSGLLGMAIEVRELISTLRGNPRRIKKLEKLAQDLEEKLLGANTASRDVLDLTQKELQSVRHTLRSLNTRNPFTKCFKASDDEATLKEVQQKLESITTHIVVVESVLQLMPRISNDNVQLPALQVGLDDRGAEILKFLQQSQEMDFRVIAIYGHPGVGKTTLLNYAWENAAGKPPFGVRAYVQIGHDATTKTIRESQTTILRQLDNRNMDFPSNDFGKGVMEKSLKELKELKRPMFLAVDNVFNTEDLKALLPDRLGRDNLSASSCIVLTCRDKKIVKTLLNICRLQEDDCRVHCFKPKYLDDDESKMLFVKCANIGHDADEHHELLDALVPKCGGLPLALKALGTVFVDESRRGREEWQCVLEQWDKLDPDDSDSAEVSKALMISFDNLKESRKVAFLDMVSIFYGWSRERVENIVGVSVVRDLINSSLVLEVA